MKKIASLILTFSLAIFSKIDGQTIIMRDATGAAAIRTNTCGASFFDSGGSGVARASGYKPNETYTITICSDDPSKKNISLGFNLLKGNSPL